MQTKNRTPTETLPRPTSEQASFGGQTDFGLALLLQQILGLVEEAKTDEGVIHIELEAGAKGSDALTGSHKRALPAPVKSHGVAPNMVVIEPSQAHSGAATQVQLSEANVRLVAEVLVDIQAEEFRYLLLRTPKMTTDEHILSPREREIVRLVARGCPNKTIAEILDISPWTVNTYLRRIFAKLDVTSRAEMVAHSIAIGLMHNN
jgi:DNA-binding CsgD family transcriptional regulator